MSTTEDKERVILSEYIYNLTQTVQKIDVFRCFIFVPSASKKKGL